MSFKNKSHKIIRKVIVVAFACILIQSILCAKGLVVQANTSQNYTTEQKAIREVADAYYNRGTIGQYCSYRRSYIDAPEEGTIQNNIYSVCSNFTFTTYYQAFGIKVPSMTNRILTYAHTYYNPNNITTNDVVEYWIKSKDSNNNTIYVDNQGNTKNIVLNTASGRDAYAKKLLNDYNLQIGDIICYAPEGGSGHALMVYEIIYDEMGNPVDAIIRESTSHYETVSTKITKGLSYADILNENNNVHEGTFKELLLANTYATNQNTSRNSVVYNFRNMIYFTILRPLLKDENGNYTGKYYYVTFKTQKNAIPAELKCNTRELLTYTIPESTQSRIKYSKMYIEKIVNVFNNSNVDLNDELEYTITIQNKSNNKYESFDVIENIPEYVEIVDNGKGTLKEGKLVWTITNLNAKESVEIKYKVKVKNNKALYGKKIISTGTVAGIAASTVSNTISNNLDYVEKEKLIEQTKTILSYKNITGIDFVKRIYQNSLKENLNLENLDLADLIKTTNSAVYYPSDIDKTTSVYKNNENSFSNMILSNYYGAVYTTSSGIVYLKQYENQDYVGTRSERADNIYSKNLQTGDVLVYKNKQTANDDVLYKTEDGTYYLIYISEEDKIKIGDEEVYGFIGINEDGSINRIYGDESINYTSHDLRALLGKDYYVILRPSMTFEVTSIADINQNDQIDLGDILLMRRHLAQENSSLVANKHTDWKLNDKKISIADLNKNNQIDIGDILKTQRYIAAKNSKEVAAKHVDWLDFK